MPQGALDITLYRDDLQTVGPRPVVGATHLPWTLDDQRVVIVDDVLYTGRTVRAALDELADFGRPARITLAVLIDRGGRELPIHADVVGRRVEVSTQRVDVFVEELDGRNEVVIASRADEADAWRVHSARTCSASLRSRRADPARARHRRPVSRDLRTADQEGADAARHDDRESLLRTVDAHAYFVRVRREAAQRRHGECGVVGIERVEGRDARRHRAQSRSDEDRHGRHSPSGVRRCALSRRTHRVERDQRRRRHARAPTQGLLDL